VNWLNPNLPKGQFALMLRTSLAGALCAGGYGVLHDQITFTVSPEYFTKLKAVQFARADFGWPVRVFVGTIGFLATWWLGLIAGWLLARLTVGRHSAPEAIRKCMHGFGVMTLCAAMGGGVGYLYGTLDRDISDWQEVAASLNIQDLRRFVCVAYIHLAGYIGAGLGLLIALFRCARVA
jgi:hypothetical protein